MPEDPIEEKSLEASPPEIQGMTRLERRKGVVGEADPEIQERFRRVATEGIEKEKERGVSFISDFRLVPEKLLAIVFHDYSVIPGIERRYSVERSYWPRDVQLGLEVLAIVGLDRVGDDNSYRVFRLIKDIESRRDLRDLTLGSNFLSLEINSPVLRVRVSYIEGGNLRGFTFEKISQRESRLPDFDTVSLSSIEESGSVNYTTKEGQEVDFKMDEDPDYVLVTSTKGEMKRVMKVPVKVDIAKIREELEDGLNLEDPYNDPPEADKWLEKDLEKVVGIVEVPKETKAPK